MTTLERRKLTASLQAQLEAIADNASKRNEIVIQQGPDTLDAVQLSAV